MIVNCEWFYNNRTAAAITTKMPAPELPREDAAPANGVGVVEVVEPEPEPEPEAAAVAAAVAETTMVVEWPLSLPTTVVLV